jgi:cGMP-specific 3',5'-cyclic phosphodiesterase
LTQGNNIFMHLSPADYRRAIAVVESAILSTDLAVYFK